MRRHPGREPDKQFDRWEGRHTDGEAYKRRVKQTDKQTYSCSRRRSNAKAIDVLIDFQPSIHLLCVAMEISVRRKLSSGRDCNDGTPTDVHVTTSFTPSDPCNSSAPLQVIPLVHCVTCASSLCT